MQKWRPFSPNLAWGDIWVVIYLEHVVLSFLLMKNNHNNLFLQNGPIEHKPSSIWTYAALIQSSICCREQFQKIQEPGSTLLCNACNRRKTKIVKNYWDLVFLSCTKFHTIKGLYLMYFFAMLLLNLSMFTHCFHRFAKFIVCL